MTERLDETPQPDRPLDEAAGAAGHVGHGSRSDGFAEWFDQEFAGATTQTRGGVDAPVEPDDAIRTEERTAELDPAVARGRTSDPDADVDHDLTAEFERDPARARAESFLRRRFRRPLAWAEADWPAERVVRLLTTALSLIVPTVIMFNLVHLNPLRLLVGGEGDLVFLDTTPTGGDFGAHVWGPAYLRDELLPNWRLNGWSMDWYAGMPAYRFYMVLPALLVVALDVVLKYGVALKLVSVLGLITLPAACWAFGRLAKFRYPMPELFAFGGLSFVLDESFSIYGGNLKSTMAGEFSFSIALSLGVLALGFLAAGLRTGKYRVITAVLIAAACVSHGIVLIFVILAAVVMCLLWLDWTRLVYTVTVGLTAVLLLAWWVVPFVWNHEYMTDMKYGSRPSPGDDSFWAMFFPLTAPLNILITTFAIIGFAMCIRRRHLTGVSLGVTGVALVVLVYLTRDSLPMIGLLWNPRLLPFLYLVRYLLMMVGIVETFSIAWNVIQDARAAQVPGVVPSTTIWGASALGVLVVLGFMFQSLPFDGTTVLKDGEPPVYSWGPIRATQTNAKALGNGWSRYNFLGYEGRNEYYTEYESIVRTMDSIGMDPALGCGRASWENHPDNGQYGTTMALMLLPHWTNGCIGSMEGLFFEASGTTPYHFLTTAAMSKQSSNPVRELRYENNDASVGVPHLQDLGVRYVLVRSPEAKGEASASPELTYLRSSEPWDVYLVSDSDIVVPLDVQPVVVRGRSGDPRERNLELGTSWFQHRDEWEAMPADDGPADWQRISVGVDLNRREGEPGDPGRQVDIVTPVEPIQRVPLPPVSVSNLDIQQQSLSFDVDQIGVPVLIKVSYFPNWKASGADGPYRIAPNMMVVVPTSEHIELDYGRTGLDYAAWLLTGLGIALCLLWRRQGDIRHLGPSPSTGGSFADALHRSGFGSGRDPVPQDRATDVEPDTDLDLDPDLDTYLDPDLDTDLDLDLDLDTDLDTDLEPGGRGEWAKPLLDPPDVGRDAPDGELPPPNPLP